MAGRTGRCASILTLAATVGCAEPTSTANDADVIAQDVEKVDSAIDDDAHFDFNRVVDCVGTLDYEKAFLFEGREGPLVKDPAATVLLTSGSAFFEPLAIVTSVYSVELAPWYIQYDSFNPIADRLAIALVEKAPGDLEFEYQLVLMISEGSRAGHVSAIHSATLDLESSRFIAKFFSCSITPLP